MSYHSKQLKNGRWGIFINNQLVATIGCPETCQKIIWFMETRLSKQEIPVITQGYAVNKYFNDLKLRA